MESDTLAQGACPDCLILVRFAGFGKRWDGIRAVDLESVKSFGDLIARPHGINIRLIRAEQAERLGGPIWQVEGLYPLLRLVDQRIGRDVVLGAAAVLIVFGTLAILGMTSVIVP